MLSSTRLVIDTILQQISKHLKGCLSIHSKLTHRLYWPKPTGTFFQSNLSLSSLGSFEIIAMFINIQRLLLRALLTPSAWVRKLLKIRKVISGGKLAITSSFVCAWLCCTIPYLPPKNHDINFTISTYQYHNVNIPIQKLEYHLNDNEQELAVEFLY